jgi:hypothetical protein
LADVITVRQRKLVGDFLARRASTAFGSVTPSYSTRRLLTDLAPSLPAEIVEAIREALPAFGRQIKDFDRADAVLTGIESRTSSPVRITRDAASLQSLNVRGLYPGGEGAGYAGGILSAGVDGIKTRRSRRARSLSSGGCMSVFGFDKLKRLRDEQGRDELGYFLAEGEHLVLELVRALERMPALRTATILAAHRIRGRNHGRGQCLVITPAKIERETNGGAQRNTQTRKASSPWCRSRSLHRRAPASAVSISTKYRIRVTSVRSCARSAGSVAFGVCCRRRASTRTTRR